MRAGHATLNATTPPQLIHLPVNSAEIRTNGETHLTSDTVIVTANMTDIPSEQLNENCVTTTPLSPCNPTDIIPRLIKAHEYTMKIGVFISLVITIVCIAATSICFIFVKQKSMKNENIATLLVLGILAAIPSIAFLILFCFLCCSLYKGMDWMNHVQHIIQIDGEIWQNQIDSIRNTVPNREMRLFCHGDIYDRLKMRPYGYIIVAEDGIIIDELFIFRYDVYVIRGVDLIDNTRQTGYILRLTLVTRLSLEKKLDKGTQILFEVYLFMAPHMQTHILADIRQNILTNSHRCLAASGFYKNSAINQH